MFQKNSPRLIIIGIVLLLAVYALYPTIKLQLLTPEEKASLTESGALAELEKRAIRRGLDLQGGMHIVLEVDIPTLVDNLASNKNSEFNDALEAAKEKSVNRELDYIGLFLDEANTRNLKLKRYYSDFGSDDSDIATRLEDEATDAINRALEILQNRIDQFGVSEPTIQKQGNRRIIVELAGIQDPNRARALLESTALLEFVLLKNPEITQDMLVRIDKVVKGSEEFDALIDQEVATTGSDTTDTTKVQQERVVDSKEVSLTELFGETAVDDTTEEDTSSVLVDEQLFQERPFSSLLLRLQNDLGVQAQNVFAVKKILEMEEVKSILKTGDSRIAWSTERETWSTADGEQESFFRLYHLEASAGLTGGVIQEAIEDLYNGQPIVRLNMNSEGAKTWSRLTGANVGKRVAIVLDKNVHMAPAIRTKITDGRTQVEGFANMAEAKDIAIVLRAGALPAPVDIIEERTVGPSLGKDSITMGTHSILIGLALVLVFMVIYYRLSGIIAAFALLWNLTLVLSILAMLKATLTLPGIAGLILTVGMSVDANVIIFERIREELMKGKTVKAAIDSGYARALTTIIDANVTTILAALVLMQFGTGPVKGFAIVLFWGIGISMFTAIFTTRTIFNMITARKNIQTLSI
ncbi:MAG: protein translocase subunit SecD [Candidatus Marinimicrobia bacterium]|jgi:preprotein translocase subunit SecD|nr:protein translocase subunit SecD [Candidatus Neomarinimicrobiota bacterium]|tara:strand:+ start:3061 stop:4977 length:1917 start_codon:yes stop_codon:yes gene_type:complete